MLQEESKWICTELLKLNKKNKVSPLLNFGSSTGHFRKKLQSFIHKNIFEPLEMAGVTVFHLDIKESDGVDFVGNVFENRELFNKIREKKINSILCSNLLEHVPDPVPFYKILEELIQDNGYILVTVPFRYPYHADPIDTKYRPTVEEIVMNFSNAKLVKGEILTIDQTHFKYMLQHPRLFFILLIRVFTPFYRFQSWKKIMADFLNFFKKFMVTCVLVQVEKK